MKGAPTHKLTLPHNEVIMLGHIGNYIHYISPYTRAIDTKLGKVLKVRGFHY